MLPLRTHDRDVTAVIARALLLLVRSVVLLVDDDQTHACERREHRRARADHDVHVSPPDPLPSVVALAVGEAAVQDRDLPAEGLAEQGGGRRSQRDLRHEHQHLPARVANGGGEPDEKLGFAASGHAVEERHAKLLLVGQTTQPIQRRGLLSRQPPAGLDG